MSRFSRKKRGRQKNKKISSVIHIFSEGKKTEPVYFNSKIKEIKEKDIRNKFKVQVKIWNRPADSGRQGMSIINYVESVVSTEDIDLKKDTVWVVYDRDKKRQDDDGGVDFRNSIEEGEKLGFKIAYSNDSFELWYLLHFDFMDSNLFRDDILIKVKENFKKEFGIEYNKKDIEYYPYIKYKECDAIRNAENLLKKHKKDGELKTSSPSTTVHLLVEELNKLK